MKNCDELDAKLYHLLANENSNGFKETITKIENNKNNALHIVSILGKLDVMNDILNQWPQLMVQPNWLGDLPIHSALKGGKLTIVNAMINWLQGSTDQRMVNKVLSWTNNKKRNTPLHIALEIYEYEYEYVDAKIIVRDIVKLYPRSSYAMNKEGICPLYVGVKKEFVELVRFMLDELMPFRDDVVACLRKGKSLLHLAVSANNKEMLEYMLKFDDKMLIKSLDKQGRTCLSYAAYMGYNEQVQIILTAVPHCAYISNKDKSFPIHHATLGGHLSVIDLLSTSSFLLDSRSQNILHLAVITFNLELLTHLTNFFDVSSLIYQKDDDGNTPLDLAMKLNAIDHDEKVIKRVILTLERATRGLRSCPIDGNLYRLLIRGEIVRISQIVSDKGFDLSDLECIENGCTILHIATSMNQPFSVMELLRNDCSTSLMYQANNNGDLPIHSAAKAGVLGSLKALLEWPNISMDVCKSMNAKGNTALHIAVSNNQQKMANYLYKQCPETAYYLNEDNICPLFLGIKIWGASDTVHDMITGLEGNIGTQSSLMGAKSVVHMAIFTRKTAILKSIMLKAPSLINTLDSKGRNPLSYAAYIGYIEGVRLFLKRFPELEFTRDQDGSFPIHQAAKGGKVEVIKILHPNLRLLNNKRQSILHVAAETGRTNVVEFLLKMEEYEELLDTGDDNGDTPLHLAVKGLHYKTVNRLTKAKQTCGNSTNNELLTPRDIFDDYLQYAAQKVPSRKQINAMNLMLKRVQGESWTLRPRRHNQEDDIYRGEKDLKQVKDNIMNIRFTNRERANTLLVVATLIITVSFAAAFTPPGGYKENIGIPALIQTPAFRLFLLCNGFAFIFSIISALTLILGMNVESLTDITLFIGGFQISIGILWMSVGFLAGSVDVQMLSLMNPKDTKWMWIIIRRLIEIVMAPVVPFVVYLCRDYHGILEVRIWYLLRSFSEETSYVDYSF